MPYFYVFVDKYCMFVEKSLIFTENNQVKQICTISLFFLASSVGYAQETWEIQKFSAFDGSAIGSFLSSPIFLLPFAFLLIIIASLWSGLLVGIWKQLVYTAPKSAAASSTARNQHRRPPSLAATPRTGLVVLSSSAGAPSLLAAGDAQSSSKKEGSRDRGEPPRRG